MHKSCLLITNQRRCPSSGHPGTFTYSISFNPHSKPVLNTVAVLFSQGCNWAQRKVDERPAKITQPGRGRGRDLEPRAPTAALFPLPSTARDRNQWRTERQAAPKETCDAGATTFLIISRCPSMPPMAQVSSGHRGAKGSTPFVSHKSPRHLHPPHPGGLQHLPPPAPQPGRRLPALAAERACAQPLLWGGAHSRWGTPDCTRLRGGQKAVAM